MPPIGSLETGSSLRASFQSSLRPTSQRLVEGARRSKETQAATTPLPVYVAEFQSVFAKEDFDILLEHRK